MLNLVIFLAAVILAIVLGTKTKINIGLYGLIFAFILGFAVCKLPAVRVLANFPTTLYYNYVIACLFYGFASGNGTIEVLAKKLMYTFRNQQWLAPVTLFLSALLISACGPTLATAIILSPMAFSLAISMGFSPLVAVLAIWGGSAIMMMFPWTATGATNMGTMLGTLTDAESYAAAYFAGAALFVFIFVEFIIVCLITKSFKVKGTMAETVTESPKFNDIQKRTIVIILVAIALTVVPSLLQLLVPNPVCAWISSNLSVQLLWTIGCVVMALCKCGDAKEVVAKVRWDTVLLLVGMSILFGLASPMGVVTTLGDILMNVPAWVIAPALAIIVAFLSFFVSGAVLGPFFVPLAPTLAAISGAPLSLIVTCVIAGANVSSISPVSQGGASALTGCTSDQVYRKTMAGMTYLAIINMIAFAVYVLVLSMLF